MMTEYVVPGGTIIVEDGIATRWDGMKLEATPELIVQLEQMAAAHSQATAQDKQTTEQRLAAIERVVAAMAEANPTPQISALMNEVTIDGVS